MFMCDIKCYTVCNLKIYLVKLVLIACALSNNSVNVPCVITVWVFCAGRLRRDLYLTQICSPSSQRRRYKHVRAGMSPHSRSPAAGIVQEILLSDTKELINSYLASHL